MTRATLHSLSQTADEWLALSTKLRQRPLTIAPATDRPVRSDVVIRIRIAKPAWRRRTAAARVGGAHRGFSDRVYSWLCQ